MLLRWFVCRPLRNIIPICLITSSMQIILKMSQALKFLSWVKSDVFSSCHVAVIKTWRSDSIFISIVLPLSVCVSDSMNDYGIIFISRMQNTDAIIYSPSTWLHLCPHSHWLTPKSKARNSLGCCGRRKGQQECSQGHQRADGSPYNSTQTVAPVFIHWFPFWETLSST